MSNNSRSLKNRWNFASARPANFTVVLNIWICTVNFSNNVFQLAVLEGTWSNEVNCVYNLLYTHYFRYIWVFTTQCLHWSITGNTASCFQRIANVCNYLSFRTRHNSPPSLVTPLMSLKSSPRLEMVSLTCSKILSPVTLLSIEWSTALDFNSSAILKSLFKPRTKKRTWAESNVISKTFHTVAIVFADKLIALNSER